MLAGGLRVTRVKRVLPHQIPMLLCSAVSVSVRDYIYMSFDPFIHVISEAENKPTL